MLAESFFHAHKNFPMGGTCLEFGVWTGGTFFWQVDQIVNKYQSSKLIGFDSWKGLPEEAEGVWRPDRHAAGGYQADKQVVINGLTSRNLLNDSRFKLVDGFYNESLTPSLQSEIKDLILVNVDVDLYDSAKDVLNFITPMLRPGVVLYFDDWKDPVDQFDGKWGEHLAWEEWTQKNPLVKYNTVAVNEANQRYMEILG